MEARSRLNQKKVNRGVYRSEADENEESKYEEEKPRTLDDYVDLSEVGGGCGGQERELFSEEEAEMIWDALMEMVG